MSGNLEKMKVLAYNAENYEDSALVGEFNTLINPASYSYNYSLVYDEQQGSGTSSANLQFQGIKPVEISFDFVFDGTGVLENAPNTTVDEQIEDFQHLVLRYEGDIHRPKYVKLIWGTLLFKGVLTSLKLEYKLFNNQGEPLRALATAAFKGSVDDDLRVAQENAQSPDLTHIVEVKPKESLPLMAYKVYKNVSPHILVAQVNNLNSIRGLKEGMSLRFPPYSKE